MSPLLDTEQFDGIKIGEVLVSWVVQELSV